MTKIIKNTHSYLCSASTYKSSLGMTKQQMFQFALEKWTVVPQFSKSRHPTCFSMLMLHNQCCFYFCNIKGTVKVLDGKDLGLEFLPNRLFIRRYPNNHTVSPFCHQMHKENCLIAFKIQPKQVVHVTYHSTISFSLNEHDHIAKMFLAAIWHFIKLAPT